MVTADTISQKSAPIHPATDSCSNGFVGSSLFAREAATEREPATADFRYGLTLACTCQSDDCSPETFRLSRPETGPRVGRCRLQPYLRIFLCQRHFLELPFHRCRAKNTPAVCRRLRRGPRTRWILYSFRQAKHSSRHSGT